MPQMFRVHRELTTRELKPVFALYAGSMKIATIPYVEEGKQVTIPQLKLEWMHAGFAAVAPEKRRALLWSAIRKLDNDKNAVISLDIYDAFYSRDNG